MAKWADFLAENKIPSYSPSSSGLRKKKPTPEEVANAKLYFQRLKQLMEYEVAIGELTPKVAQQILDVAMKTPEGKIFTDAPYASDLIGTVDKKGNISVIPDWQWNLHVSQQQADLVEYQKDQQVKTIKLQATKRSYLPQLQEYLGEAVKNNTITQEQASQIYQTEESQLDLGVEPSTLQNYEGVTEWGKSLGIAGKEKAQEERQTKIATGEAMGSVFQTQSDILQREDLISRKQAELDRIATQGRTEQISRGISNSLMRGGEAQQRAELFKQFEDVKQQKLSQLDPDMDWVQRWFVEHEENPHTPLVPTTQDRIDALGGELQKWQSIGQHYADAPVNVGDTVTWGQIADESKVRIMQMLEDIKNAPPDAGSDSVTAVKETAPTTPEWLSKLVPGLKTGQPIKSNVELPTPSLQQWGKLSPSTQAQYAGFSKWAGTPIKDTLARMNLMRPETPRGAGRFSWNPTRQ